MGSHTRGRGSGMLLVIAALACLITPTMALGGVKVTKGRMTGGGSVFTSTGVRVTHGFELRCKASDPRQNLEINWAGNKWHLTDLYFAPCVNQGFSEEPPEAGFDTYRGRAFGKLNGVAGSEARFEFIDKGEPGGVGDRATIEIWQGAAGSSTKVLSLTGPLNKGNHQAHAVK